MGLFPAGINNASRLVFNVRYNATLKDPWVSEVPELAPACELDADIPHIDQQPDADSASSGDDVHTAMKIKPPRMKLFPCNTPPGLIISFIGSAATSSCPGNILVQALLKI